METASNTAGGTLAGSGSPSENEGDVRLGRRESARPVIVIGGPVPIFKQVAELLARRPRP